MVQIGHVAMSVDQCGVLVGMAVAALESVRVQMIVVAVALTATVHMLVLMGDRHVAVLMFMAAAQHQGHPRHGHGECCELPPGDRLTESRP